MATIKSQLVLNDGMSAVLKKITSALDTTLSSFERVQRLSGSAMDVAEIEAARGALADADRAVDEMAESYRRAAQEEKRLNQDIHEGTSALDRMAEKAASLVGAYMSLNAVKDFAMGSMEAANTQISAQRQLHTVLNNMGAEERYQAPPEEAQGGAVESALDLDTAGAVKSYEALADRTDGAELGNTLALDTAQAGNGYTALADMVDGTELGNVLTLDTGPAETSYAAFAAGLAGEGPEAVLAVRADTAQAETAYDAILAKAAEIQSKGVYGDEIMIAGAAEFATYFSDADAILSMMGTLSDYAMGMSALDGKGLEVDSAAMVQYAENLGKLMSGSYDAMTKKGFQFSDTQKAIIEGTATEAQIVSELGEEYLGVSREMQAAAAIGAVIGESWGGLYEAMSDTPEGKLLRLKNALGDIRERVGAGIYPAVLGLVDLVQENMPLIEMVAMGVTTALGSALTLLTGMAEKAMAFASAVVDNWSWISPIVYGVVAALAAYAGYLGVTKAMELASAAGKAILTAAEYAHAAATGTAVASTTAETAAQLGLNTALLSCPITWIVLGVIALTAGIAALCAWIAKTTGIARTGFGVLTGGINVVIQAVANVGLTAANVALGIWNALGAVCANLGAAFHNVISDVQSWFYGLLSTALTVVAGICEALNKLPFVELDYSGITGKAEEYAAKSAKAAGDKKDYLDVSAAFDAGFGTFDAFSEGWARDAFRAGAAWGDGAADQVSGLLDGLRYEPGSIEDYADGGPEEFGLGHLESDVGDIAESTGGMADALEVGGEELKYLRDIAEREAIDRYTTAEVRIDMTGMTNRIDSSMDLDGVIRELTEGFTEALVTAAEGVHP